MTQTELNLPVVNPPGIVPEGATLIREETWNSSNYVEGFGSKCLSRYYLLESKETPKMVTKTVMELRFVPPSQYAPKGYVVHKMTERHQKFLCVNGLLAGQRVTEERGALSGYVRYSCSGIARRSGKVIPRNVLIYI